MSYKERVDDAISTSGQDRDREVWDVVVVGAGPAGSVAALVLARGGAHVALVDKATFPRDKACGDLVGPRGVRLLEELGLGVPAAGAGSDILVVGPSGKRARLPAFPGRTYADHGIVVPRRIFDDHLRSAAVGVGARPLTARIVGVERGPHGEVDALTASDGRSLRGRVIIGADGALSPIAHLTGMLDPGAAMWGFAIRGYLPAEVPLPLLVLHDTEPRRIFPGYGWLFPGADGRANVGIGLALDRRERATTMLRGELTRLCKRLRSTGDIAVDAIPGRVTGGWLRMGGIGSVLAQGNVLLVGDAAGLVNPLQGEGIAQAMISARLAAEAVLADATQASEAYGDGVEDRFGRFMGGAAAVQAAMLGRPRFTSSAARLLTAPPLRTMVAGTWSLYLNGLADGARPGPSAWGAQLVERIASRIATTT